jgi:hypothetical protein
MQSNESVAAALWLGLVLLRLKVLFAGGAKPLDRPSHYSSFNDDQVNARRLIDSMDVARIGQIKAHL